MNILLDTHIFLWILTQPNSLGKKTKSLLKSKDNELYLSAVSYWEICIKKALNKLSFPSPPGPYISEFDERT